VITLYPAIDLKGGQAVRLRQGDFDQSTVFSDDPVAQARAFAEQGADSLHVVDLDGAREGEPVHAALVASIAAAFPGTVHFGGGLRSRPAIETALATGVDRVVVGTAALDDRDLLEWATGSWSRSTPARGRWPPTGGLRSPTAAPFRWPRS
jgi:phosphoribosylformimino-5-aminoimidazole carboxamide ribotide isomerase